MQVEQGDFAFSGIRTDTLHIEDERFRPSDYIKKGEEDHENLKFDHIEETSNLVKIVDADLKLKQSFIAQDDDGNINFSTAVAAPDFVLDSNSLASHVNLWSNDHTTFLKDVKLEKKLDLNGHAFEK